MLDGFGQRGLDVPAVTDQRWLVARIHPPFEPHFTEHHVRVLDEILVDRNDFALGRGVGNYFFPRRTARGFLAPALFENDDIGGDFGIGVALESGVGQSDCADQIGAVGDMFAERVINLVHRAARRDERHESAGADFFQSCRKEIIVNQKSLPVELRVIRLVIAKGDV